MGRTLVVFHAHPDDETITTGGTMMRAKAEGHRVVLVIATRGELGEAPPALSPGEGLARLRVAETHAAAEILGVDRVEFLGYHDSGMAGEDTNHDPRAFAAAPLDEAAARLADLLREERADILTVYDDNGGYGHPDHIQVHRVGVRAAAMARTPNVFEATVNREHLVRLIRAQADTFAGETSDDGLSEEEIASLGVPEAQITTFVDVREFVDRKRAAMAAHASQIGPESFFLTMAPDAFREAFGWEWFIRRGARSGVRESNLFDSITPRAELGA